MSCHPLKTLSLERPEYCKNGSSTNGRTFRGSLSIASSLDSISHPAIPHESGLLPATIAPLQESQ